MPSLRYFLGVSMSASSLSVYNGVEIGGWGVFFDDAVH